jgi:hypothetical protein
MCRFGDRPGWPRLAHQNVFPGDEENWSQGKQYRTIFVLLSHLRTTLAYNSKKIGGKVLFLWKSRACRNDRTWHGSC